MKRINRCHELFGCVRGRNVLSVVASLFISGEFEGTPKRILPIKLPNQQPSTSSTKKKNSKVESEEEEDDEEELESSFNTKGKKSFKVDVKMNMPTYDGAGDAKKLGNWIGQLETYFTIHGYTSTQKLSFARLKLSSHPLTCWNAYLKHNVVLKLTWRKFKELIKKQFYPIGYEEERWFQ
ncbi:hypothetical protein LWI29_016413 [Acer saccharum]|uniref:Retrotransposon gag domain-containing protein n=1 Tax=Acer saccharum TaxID=4024 RepID=A0AA39RX58_ACESA|nr:hypothetical protein LWI29_016413 [Acer saccharum]